MSSLIFVSYFFERQATAPEMKMEGHMSEQIVANSTQNSSIHALKYNNHCAYWHVS